MHEPVADNGKRKRKEEMKDFYEDRENADYYDDS